MIQQVYLDPKLEKQMGVLRRAGKKGMLAAQQADAIIDRLQAEPVPAVEVATTTRHGELRIRGCIKYDLGSGYRLVTFKRGGDLFILYVGTHDDCHRWIENNRDLPLEIVAQRCRQLPVTHDAGCHDGPEKDQPDAGLMADDCELEEIEDRHLRIVFSGLVQSNRANQ